MNKKTLPFKTGKITVIKKAFWNNPIEVSEETIQKQVVAYCRMKNIEVTPSLNGIKMKAGMANKYKSLGMEKGVADLHFHDSNDRYHCLYIELKKLRKKTKELKYATK